MMLKNFYFIILFVVFIFGCSVNEVKTVEIKQDLNQVTETGNQVGNVPPDFTILDTDGNSISLNDSISEKPTVVYFLATWCPYCSQDFSQLSKVYPNYQEKINFIAISLDLSEDNKKLKDYKSKFPQLSKVHFAEGREQILKDYSVIRTTTKYAIKNGTIIYSSSGVFNEGYWKTLFEGMIG